MDIFPTSLDLLDPNTYGFAWFWIAICAGLVVQLLVFFAVRRQQLLSMPNARSSHTHPTPTMGGLSIVIIVVIYLSSLGGSPVSSMVGWWIMALLTLAAIGLWDDVHELPALPRLMVQFAAATAILWSLQDVSIEGLVNLSTHLGSGWLSFLAWPVLLVGIVWFVNLFNFMDGIDGIAGCQVLTYCLGVVLLGDGLAGWVGDFVWVLAGSTVAFLAFNWPPAKIFMGDVGSNFLGLLVAIIALYLWQSERVPLVGSLILLTGFWFDASHTLCVRIVSGQKFTQAHRSHLYQRLTDWADERVLAQRAAQENSLHSAKISLQEGGNDKLGHRLVTLGYFAHAIFWLMPIAFAVTHWALPGWLGIILALVPVAYLSRRFRAGKVPMSSSE